MSWLVACVVAMAISYLTVTVVTQRFEIPLPPEHEPLANQVNNEEAEIEARAIEANVAGRNAARLTAVLAAALAVIFGLTAGLIHGSPIRGLIGGVVGACVAVALVFAIGDPVIQLVLASRANLEQADIYGILVHFVQWAAIGVPVAVAVGLGAGKVSAGGKAIFAMLIAAALGATIYVIAGGVLAPMENLANAKPADGTPMLIWSLLPPLLAGLVLVRSRP